MLDNKRVRVDFSSVKEPLETYPWPIMLNQGFHWMDKYGDAYWIPDMETDYLRNAIRFAESVCRSISNAWWRFAFSLRGEMAIDTAESIAMRYDEYDVPLVKGLARELGKREGNELLIEDWELEGYVNWQELKGYEHMAVTEALRLNDMHPTPTPGVYKIGEPWDPDTDGRV